MEKFLQTDSLQQEVSQTLKPDLKFISLIGESISRLTAEIAARLIIKRVEGSNVSTEDLITDLEYIGKLGQVLIQTANEKRQCE